MPDPNKMQKFVDKINSTEPKKSYGFDPVITDNSVEQILTPPITNPVKNLDLKEAEKRTQISRIQGQGSVNFDPSKGHAVEMTSNPIEWFIGGGAAKPAFNLFKNWGQKAMSQVSRYAKKQLPKAAGEASVEVGQRYIGK